MPSSPRKGALGFAQLVGGPPLLGGWEKSTGAVTIAWIDTWHNSDRIMISTGEVNKDGALDVRGTYAAPPNPDWGWHTLLSADEHTLSMVMFNVDPQGYEELAVDAQYRRITN